MLELHNITKSYGTVVANDRVSLQVSAGEIVALVGENGAGKSTLLSIVGGFQQPDAGSITVNGQHVTLDSPRTALRAGISVVHQHFALVPSFTVREQMALAGFQSSRTHPPMAEDIALHSIVEDLPLVHQQRVELARALVTRPKLLLLDEPTSMLAPRESERLFDVLRRIREAGTTIILVTHKIEEALDLSDRIVVLRNGRLGGREVRTDGRWTDGTRERILNAMFGFSPEAASAQAVSPMDDSPAGDALLAVDRLTTLSADGRVALRDITFTVPEGGRLAIVGVGGQGQRELLEALAGYIDTGGAIRLQDRARAAHERRAAIGYITDDRIGEGGIADLDLTGNLLLKHQRLERFTWRGLLRRNAIRRFAERAIRDWRIEPDDPDRRYGTFSGGNMQKALLAREMARRPQLMLAANPAHGLDVRTAGFLWARLAAFAREGGGVIFTTTDLSEGRSQADLVAVLFEGRLSTPQPVMSLSERELGTMMIAGW